MSNDSPAFPHAPQAPNTSPHLRDLTTRRFEDIDFQHSLDDLIAACAQRMADDAEVTATAARISDRDPDSWVDEWIATAGSAWATAVRAEANGQSSAARDAYRHASTYYAAALDRVFHCSEPERQPAIWQRQRFCFKRALALGPDRSERISIPYGDYKLPGFFFPATDAEQGEARPLLILNHGLDRPTSQTLAYGEEIARACRLHWMTFDGPGQQATLYEQGVACRQDWETVLSAVIDALLARPDVDPHRIASIGIGHGGYLLTRALCFEQRIAAAAVDPGIVDLAAPWIEPLPELMIRQLDQDNRSAFDREIRLTELFSPASAATLRMTGQAFGVDVRSRFDLFTLIRAYRLGKELSSATTPLLIVDDGHAGPWSGQSRLLNERLGATSTLIAPAERSRTGTGPRSGLPRSDRRITGWLNEHLAAHDQRG